MILSLETATKICAVALHDKGKLIAEKYIDIEHAHSSQLTVLIESLLQENHTDKKALQAVAVSAGPGSYTGLRIGVSAGKGLCFALQIPLLAVNTLEALALPIRARVETNTLLCPMLDARRMEVYCAIFDTAGKTISPTEAKIIDQESFADILQHQKIVFFGEGAGKCQSLLQHENAVFLDHILPTADSIGKLAYTRYENQQFEDLAYFEPLYLKDFVNNTKVK
jgi:tRNA threonylcarbamoyladenosine biosynthesis protein TsaB